MTHSLNEVEKEFLKESNAIEGVYDDDSLQQAVYAWEYLKKQKKLTPSVILKVHKKLMINQPLLPSQIGYFRTEQVWVGGQEGIHHSYIPMGIRHWCAGGTDSRFLTDRMIKADHIAFERIHPFIDGNGRVGRMLMNWQRLNAGLPILVIKEAEKQVYYLWFSLGGGDEGK